MVKYKTYRKRKYEEFINPMTDYNNFIVSDVNETVRMFNSFIAELGHVDLDIFYTVICGASNYKPSYTDLNYGWTKRINIKDNFVMGYNCNATHVCFKFNLPEPKIIK